MLKSHEKLHATNGKRLALITGGRVLFASKSTKNLFWWLLADKTQEDVSARGGGTVLGDAPSRRRSPLSFFRAAEKECPLFMT